MVYQGLEIKYLTGGKKRREIVIIVIEACYFL